MIDDFIVFVELIKAVVEAILGADFGRLFHIYVWLCSGDFRFLC